MNYNTIVIGGGVAGLTAGMYLARANFSCLVLEGKFWGGQTALLNKVENYPAVKNTSGFEIAQNLYQQVKELGIELKNELVTNVDEDKNGFKVITNKSQYVAKNIIIATGAKTTQLGLQNEQQYIGKGLSYCATCDGNFFKNKSVAVVGMGKTALEDVEYLSNVCAKVYWIVPTKSTNVEIKHLNNVEMIFASEVVELEGKQSLSGIIIHNKRINKRTALQVDGLFVTLGRQPDLSWLNVEIKTNKNGYVQVDKNCKTSNKRIFACGDITSRQLKQIVTACSDGAIASSYIIAKG